MKGIDCMSDIFGSPAVQEEEEFVVKFSELPSQQRNFSEEVRDFSVPNGVYLAKCINVEKTLSKAGNDQFVFTFLGVEKEAKARQFKLYAPATGPGTFRTKEVLQAFGLDVTTANLAFKRKEVLDKNVELKLEKDAPYNGKINSKIAKVLPTTRQADDIPF